MVLHIKKTSQIRSKSLYSVLFLIMINGMIFIYVNQALASDLPQKNGDIALCAPNFSNTMSLEIVLNQRRSVRFFCNESLTITQLSQILWAAQGVTHANGFRTAPSAGALYPLDIYIIVSQVKDIKEGIYHYIPDSHKLSPIQIGHFREALYLATYKQKWVLQSPINLVICGVFQKTTQKYGKRGYQYVYMEAGHVAQNIYLQTYALQLGTVEIGAFNDQDVMDILHIDASSHPICIMPIGKPE